MESDTKYTLDEAQLQLARQTNGETWKLLEKENLSQDEKDLLLYTAFASAYHWNSTGNLINKQRAEWLISRSYSQLEMGDSALLHAKRCFELTQVEQLEFQDFDYAYASEAMARSYALLGETDNASLHYDKALDFGQKIAGEKDRELFMGDLQAGNWNGFAAK